VKHFKQFVPALVLALLLAACLIGVYLLRDTSPRRVAKQQQPSNLVDEQLLKNTQQVALLADTAAEHELADQAVRLADHELDTAFASAMREAAAPPPPPTGPLKVLTDQITALQAKINTDQARVADLTPKAKTNTGAAEQLELAKAQLTLDQDELGDSQQDLARQGGDPRAQIARQLQDHETAEHNAALQKQKTPAILRAGTLSEQTLTWFALRNRAQQLDAARDQAAAKTSALEREHKALEALLQNKPVTDAGSPAAAASSSDSDDSTPEEDTATLVDRLHHLSDKRKTLAELDKRIQDTQQLSEVYKRWIGEVESRRQGVLHLLLISLSVVFAILFVVVIVDGVIRHAFDRQPDHRRRKHLRVMATIAAQAVGALLVLLVVFGAPTQTATLIGLTTAGLTVALKDFIVAFFGWFVLLGRNGVRVGDWVEIEGVGGEVIEIGILKTVLLEVGTSANTGHPTGRRVAFMNKFAIEDHYFNFSTAGQWLWDELQMTLPLSSDPYQSALAIREKVEHETLGDAEEAEKEWERVTHQYGTRPFSAKPEVDLRPSVNGLEVRVRYITRAPQRFEVKSKLFQEIVELVHKPVS
jgi:small-conductance mechanosensitive channel